MENNDSSLVPRPHPLLDPARLAEGAAKAIRDILAAGASANTARSYRTAVRYWAAWYLGRYGRAIALPVPAAVVLQFVVDHLARPRPDGSWRQELPPALDAALVAAGAKAAPGPWKRGTIEHRLSVLAAVHRRHDQANPCEAPAVRQLLKSARRAGAQRGEAPARKAALTREPLEALLASCDDSLEGLRDRALLLFGFASGGRRRSEIAAAQVDQLQPVGPDAYVFRLGASKTDPTGTASVVAGGKPIVSRAARALAAWVVAANIEEGALFRRCGANASVRRSRRPQWVRSSSAARAGPAGTRTSAGTAYAPSSSPRRAVSRSRWRK